jgi:DNA polymerase III delta prime subunit
MRVLIDTFKTTGNIHHAYLLEGEREGIRKELLHFIEKHLKINIIGNPDVWQSQFETFTIDDARKLREAQANKAIAGEKKIFIIETRGMTLEAQNSLLKVFEEPTPHTHFFMIVPSAEVFLPTLRSRTVIISQHNDTSSVSAETKEFLHASKDSRLKMIEEIIEEKDKARAIGLIDGLLKALHSKASPQILQELLKCRMYLHDRSPSLKLLLEHISLILPVE